ncbi:hypothetical protein PHYSODRAFT_265356 [Phytophthora sojae]|uniref:RxLR effector protein n=1 Tax=Phytophthora sojae (strain P6497) TaxID=1094619 RepID=G4Z621_PHYSP|nr:hypothetical protein PHYSODRAFT_265356 [Phytophthora sojae]EGZ20942.1 hypothetical protein PHYSODRAFT_265356 [Phytophthora sojae]|eukprot:XP_009523659.1 hypothetical protein PHYSODRAFT_265356 [Phytophthora sojae]
MRLPQVLLVVAACFLLTCEALSTGTGSNQAQIVKATSERTISKSEMKAILSELAIEWAKAKANFNHLLFHPKYPQYQARLNEVITTKKLSGAP